MPSNVEIRRKWAVYVRSRDIAVDTKARHIRYVDDWLDWLGERKKNVLTARPADALEYWQTLQGGYSPGTLQLTYTALRGLYRWLQVYHICRDPFGAVTGPRKREPAPRPIVNADELAELVTGWTPARWTERRDRAFVAVLASTGCRVSEACNMDVTDFDPRRSAVHIRKGKGRKVRWGALVGETKVIIEEYIRHTRPLRVQPHEPALWLNNRGRRITPESARAAVRRACEKIGLDVHLTPHGVRASAITALYDNGADLLACKDFAGHEQAFTTDKHYIRRAPNRVVDIANRYHPLADFKRDPDEED